MRAKNTDVVLVVLSRKNQVARYPIQDVPQDAKRKLFKILFGHAIPLNGDIGGRLCLWAKNDLGRTETHLLIRDELCLHVGKGYTLSVERRKSDRRRS